MHARDLASKQSAEPVSVSVDITFSKMGRLDFYFAPGLEKVQFTRNSGRSILSEQPYPIIGLDLKENGDGLPGFFEIRLILGISACSEHSRGSQLVLYSPALTITFCQMGLSLLIKRYKGYP
jgi:hypothetical protein